MGQSDRRTPPRLFPKNRVHEYPCGGQCKERNTGIGGGEMHNQRYGVSWAFMSKGGRERDRCVRQYHARGVWGPWGPAGDGGDGGVSQRGVKVPPWMDSCPMSWVRGSSASRTSQAEAAKTSRTAGPTPAMSQMQGLNLDTNALAPPVHSPRVKGHTTAHSQCTRTQTQRDNRWGNALDSHFDGKSSAMQTPQVHSHRVKVERRVGAETSLESRCYMVCPLRACDAKCRDARNRSASKHQR